MENPNMWRFSVSRPLHELVEKYLLPEVASKGMRVVHQEASTSFDNAFVVLQSDDLRVRVVRERGQVFADFGSAAEPGTWFDSAVVMEHLGLSESAGFHDRDAAKALRGLAKFLRALWDELAAEFSSAAFAATKRELIAVRERRDVRRFGAAP
ncbi:MAG TPA: hypothetical protein VFQ38_23490 [Longimicrobiales bacterium]|nr:hypothetical protein [Longimicrobiales bacterium]